MRMCSMDLREETLGVHEVKKANNLSVFKKIRKEIAIGKRCRYDTLDYDASSPLTIDKAADKFRKEGISVHVASTSKRIFTAVASKMALTFSLTARLVKGVEQCWVLRFKLFDKPFACSLSINVGDLGTACGEPLFFH